MKARVFPLMFLLTFQAALAIDVLVVTTLNYPDAAVASVVSKKFGLPVLVTEAKELSEETKNALIEINPETVYLVGGPIVIGEEVEDAIEELGFEVVRIWGVTRYGTAVKLMNYFFEKSPEAVLVVDRVTSTEKGKFKEVGYASVLARNLQIPIFIIPAEELPLEVEESLVSLGVKKVLIVGEVSNEVLSRLSELGISYEVIGKRAEEIEEKVEEKLVEKFRGKPLLIICAGNASDTIASSVVAEHVIFVKGKEDVDIERIKQLNFSRVMVLGEPTCAKEVAEYLEANGIEVELVSGRLAKLAGERMRKKIPELKRIWEFRKRVLERIAEKRAEEMLKEVELKVAEAKFMKCVNRSLDFEEIKLKMEKVSEAFRKDVPKDALKMLISITQEIRKALWKCRPIVKPLELEEEFKSKRKIAERIKEKVREECLERIKELADKEKYLAEELPKLMKGDIKDLRKALKLCFLLRRGPPEILKGIKEREILPVPIKQIGREFGKWLPR